MSIRNHELQQSQAGIWVVSPSDILSMVRDARREYTRGFMAHADGKRVVSLSSLPEDVQAARVDLHRLTSGVVGWFNDMRGNDLFVEGIYDRHATVELGAQGMVERVTPAPEWDREIFSGIATLAGASLQEAGSFTQDCVVELHTYPKPGEPQTRTLAMPLAAMVSMDYPSSPRR